MTWTEIIHIRAHSGLEAKDVIAAFYQLSFPRPDTNLADISFHRNRCVSNDFSIRLTWYGEMPGKEKSPLGYQLAEAFSKIGLINHTAWIRETSLFLLNDRFNPADLGDQR